jgi:hypothetical protein
MGITSKFDSEWTNLGVPISPIKTTEKQLQSANDKQLQIGNSVVGLNITDQNERIYELKI